MGLSIYDSLNSFAGAALKAKAEVEKRGGRSFKLMNNKEVLSVKLKNLEDHLDKLAKKESAKADNREITQRTIYEITNTLTEKHFAGVKKLAKSKFWVRLLTVWRSVFGNLFRPSHLTHLRNIENHYLLPQSPSEELKKLYERLIDKNRKTSIELLSKAWLGWSKNPDQFQTESSNEFVQAEKTLSEDFKAYEQMDPGSKLWLVENLKSRPKILQALSFHYAKRHDGNSNVFPELITTLARRNSDFAKLCKQDRPQQA